MHCPIHLGIQALNMHYCTYQTCAKHVNLRDFLMRLVVGDMVEQSRIRR
jgi:hypothetical protein